MNLLLSTLLLFCISFSSFSQNYNKARVLLAYNAFSSDKDTLQIGDTLSYNSENQNKLIFLENNAYLALMNENGSILEWKNKEKGNYKIEFDESDTTFNGARKYLINYSEFVASFQNRESKKNRYLGMRKTGAVSCPPMPKEIEILAESKSTYLKDSLQIFVEYFEDLLREDEEIKPTTLKIEIKDLRNNLLYNQKLDTNFFFFDWNKIVEEQTTVMYNFSVQTTKSRNLATYNLALSKAKQPLSYQQEYFQNKAKTAIDVFLQLTYISQESNLNIYAYQLYHYFLKELPKEAHSIIPTWEDFKENYGVGYIR